MWPEQNTGRWSRSVCPTSYIILTSLLFCNKTVSVGGNSRHRNMNYYFYFCQEITACNVVQYMINIADELADMALHSESDSVRDECSSGIRSEAEEDDRGRPVVTPRKPGQLGSTPNHLSLSTTSSLSSCSNPSQARLVQSSLRDSRDGGAPPAPPPRTSSASANSSVDNGGPGGGHGVTDLGKTNNGNKTTCMQCYLSGHSDGSLDSVDPSTEGSSSAETGTGTPSAAAGVGAVGSHDSSARDRDSGIMEDRFDTSVDQILILDQKDKLNN